MITVQTKRLDIAAVDEIEFAFAQFGARHKAEFDACLLDLAPFTAHVLAFARLELRQEILEVTVPAVAPVELAVTPRQQPRWLECRTVWRGREIAVPGGKTAIRAQFQCRVHKTLAQCGPIRVIPDREKAGTGYG
jgi:hypothetical protein